MIALTPYQTGLFPLKMNYGNVLFAGVDLHGVPFIENLDNLSLITSNKIYIADTVYTYLLQRGIWHVQNFSTTDKHQAAAPSAGEARKDGEEEKGEEMERSDRTVRLCPRYPSVLITVTEAQTLPQQKTTAKRKGNSSLKSFYAFYWDWPKRDK